MNRLAIVAVLGVAAFGCRQNIDYLDVQPTAKTFTKKGEQEWVKAMPMSRKGTSYPGVKATYTSKDPSVVSVDETGQMTALKSGRTEIVASVGEITATVPVEVLYPEKFTVSPSPLKLKRDGEPVDFQVKVYDYLGREMRNRKAMFKSSDQKIVSMGQDRAFPGDPGEAKVEVRVGDLVQVVDVKVEK